MYSVILYLKNHETSLRAFVVIISHKIVNLKSKYAALAGAGFTAKVRLFDHPALGLYS